MALFLFSDPVVPGLCTSTSGGTAQPARAPAPGEAEVE